MRTFIELLAILLFAGCGGRRPLEDAREFADGASESPAPGEVQPAEQVVLPLKQHLGAPCEAKVRVGDHVT